MPIQTRSHVLGLVVAVSEADLGVVFYLPMATLTLTKLLEALVGPLVNLGYHEISPAVLAVAPGGSALLALPLEEQIPVHTVLSVAEAAVGEAQCNGN